MHILLMVLLALFSFQSYAGGALESLNAIEPSALLVQNAQGKVLYEKEPNRLLVPASTVKLVTALIALEHWGRDYRIATEVYFDSASKVLTVKGLGDPFLVSEEIDLIVQKIKKSGINALSAVYSDSDYFSSDIEISGQGESNNPYDASVAALAANFNTIQVLVTENGIKSGEKQTPITTLASQLSKGLSNGLHRINIGESNRSSQYFIEILVAKLKEEGVEVFAEPKISGYQEKPELLFAHYNSRTLEKVITAMLKFSNNFIANQLFLLLGAEIHGAPASLEKSHKVVTKYIEDKFNWSKFALLDGAGLSRENRLSVYQLIQVAEEFAPFRDLMPMQNKQILAKSGTLNGVSSYAGYLWRGDEWLTFALIINEPVRYQYKHRLAEELLAYPFDLH